MLSLAVPSTAQHGRGCARQAAQSALELCAVQTVHMRIFDLFWGLTRVWIFLFLMMVTCEMFQPPAVMVQANA